MILIDDRENLSKKIKHIFDSAQTYYSYSAHSKVIIYLLDEVGSSVRLLLGIYFYTTNRLPKKQEE